MARACRSRPADGAAGAGRPHWPCGRRWGSGGSSLLRDVPLASAGCFPVSSPLLWSSLADLGAAPPGGQIWHLRVGGGRPRTGETPGRFRVDLDAGGAPVPLSLLRAGRASRSVPLLLLPSPGESLGLLAGRWRRSGVSALPGGAVPGVVGSCGPSAWRQRCSIPLVAGIGGGVWVLPHPSAAPRFVCWLVAGRQWASACSARSGRRGDSGLPSGSGPRQWAAESMVSFKRSGPSCPRQLSA